MKLTEQLADYVHAAFAGIWVRTHEPDEAERDVRRLAAERGWRLAVWDVALGLRVQGQPLPPAPDTAGDPLAALRALPGLAQDGGTALLLLHQFHRFLGNVE